MTTREIQEHIDFDVALEVLNNMFVFAIQDSDNAISEEERERIDKKVEMYRWELKQLNGADENARRSMVDKALGLYGPIIKAKLCRQGKV